MNSEADDCVSLVAPSNANMEVKVSLQWGVEKGELPMEGYESDEGNKKSRSKGSWGHHRTGHPLLDLLGLFWRSFHLFRGGCECTMEHEMRESTTCPFLSILFHWCVSFIQNNSYRCRVRLQWKKEVRLALYVYWFVTYNNMFAYEQDVCVFASFICLHKASTSNYLIEVSLTSKTVEPLSFTFYFLGFYPANLQMTKSNSPINMTIELSRLSVFIKQWVNFWFEIQSDCFFMTQTQWITKLNRKKISVSQFMYGNLLRFGGLWAKRLGRQSKYLWCHFP